MDECHGGPKNEPGVDPVDETASKDRHQNFHRFLGGPIELEPTPRLVFGKCRADPTGQAGRHCKNFARCQRSRRRNSSPRRTDGRPEHDHGRIHSGVEIARRQCPGRNDLRRDGNHVGGQREGQCTDSGCVCAGDGGGSGFGPVANRSDGAGSSVATSSHSKASRWNSLGFCSGGCRFLLVDIFGMVGVLQDRGFRLRRREPDRLFAQVWDRNPRH
mmetsp:Transcript_17574/g.48530  ORF Transcript_17574/g.48530 Transcript_17574/m.48530 type:complete len:216 (-) Transcript_17574:3081-3728(-)